MLNSAPAGMGWQPQPVSAAPVDVAALASSILSQMKR
jgi:hypothetical protein